MCAFTSEQSNVTFMKRKLDQRGLNYLNDKKGSERKVRGDIWLHRLHSSFTVFFPSEEFYLNNGEHSNDSNDPSIKQNMGVHTCAQTKAMEF